MIVVITMMMEGYYWPISRLSICDTLTTKRSDQPRSIRNAACFDHAVSQRHSTQQVNHHHEEFVDVEQAKAPLRSSSPLLSSPAAGFIGEEGQGLSGRDQPGTLLAEQQQHQQQQQHHS
jgi:hypothetical protein